MKVVLLQNFLLQEIIASIHTFVFEVQSIWKEIRLAERECMNTHPPNWRTGHARDALVTLVLPSLPTSSGYFDERTFIDERTVHRKDILPKRQVGENREMFWTLKVCLHGQSFGNFQKDYFSAIGTLLQNHSEFG